jgi:hypothetical protein
VLEPWQRDIVERYPEDFILGCIEIMGRPVAPGPFIVARERARRVYSPRSYVGRGLPMRKFAIAASS